jgi:DNA-binding HxlR family transcriptional regulator
MVHRLHTHCRPPPLINTMSRPTKHLPTLPAERALKVISGRWKAVVLYHLYGGPQRLSTLGRLMPAVHQKVLIQQLREMEGHGLVLRSVDPQQPGQVHYSASVLGRSLEPVLMALCDWGRHHAGELDDLDRLADCGPAAHRPVLTVPPGDRATAD